MRLFSKAKKPVARTASSHNIRQIKRRLVCESLESRQQMAADPFNHNFVMPEDTDADGYVSAIDALVVINAINAINEKGGSVQVDASVDVDADGVLTPLDALFVVNFLNRSSESGVRQASAVDPESRIFRIELAIAEQRLPSSMELGTAQHLLAVLRAGGYPEIGDRIRNGELTNDLGMSEVEKITEVEIARYGFAPVWIRLQDRYISLSSHIDID
jgi:hypothetical protein